MRRWEDGKMGRMGRCEDGKMGRWEDEKLATDWRWLPLIPLSEPDCGLVFTEH
jgi:hypothetical protein